MADFTEIKDAITQKFSSLGVASEVIYWGNSRGHDGGNEHRIVARVPMKSEEAFDFVEGFNLPFSSTNGSYTIRQTASERRQDNTDSTNGYFGFVFIAERNCL